MMKFSFAMPTKIFFSRGAINLYGQEMVKLGSKALIVTGANSSKKNGSLQDMIKALASLSISYIVFNQVEENPSLENISAGADLGKGAGVDFVIGIGGGSPLDAAKAIAVFIKNPHIDKDNVFSSGILTGLPVVAVPTTAGTGSEVTPYSIVTVHSEQTKKNLGQRIFPEIAYVDTSYTDSMSEYITINTAIDAFSHLVEGYLSTQATIFSDLYAERGLALFPFCFASMLKKDFKSEFRDRVMLASLLGGITIAHTGTSLPHGMGYALTYHKNIPHGLANGVLTVEYLKCFKKQDKVNKLLKLLEMQDLEELDAILSKLMQVEAKLSSKEITQFATEFCQNKQKLQNHPELVTADDIQQIYRKSFS